MENEWENDVKPKESQMSNRSNHKNPTFFGHEFEGSN
jgi:hypothetical protein